MRPDDTSDPRPRSHACPCGWKGPSAELRDEVYETLVERCCPECGARLLVVPFPPADEVRRAAAAGDEEAERMLAHVEAAERRAAEWERCALRRASQLAEIEGAGPLPFEWDVEGGGGAAPYHVIRHRDRVVWREPARYEDRERFHEVKAILKERYGARFERLEVTAEARRWLVGEAWPFGLEPR